MRASVRLTCVLAAMLACPQVSAGPAPDPLDRLLQSLMQPLPGETVFVERREADVLDAPLLVGGRLSRPDEDTLVREVLEPYRETSTIHAGRVRVEREDGRERTFSLRRAPELAALLDSLQALLSADRDRLERHFEVEFGQDEDAWRLRLLPREARVRQRILELRVHGADDSMRCLVIEPVEGHVSRMLLGEAATMDAVAFDAECGEPPAP